MKANLRLSVLLGCLLTVPFLATTLRGDAEPADPSPPAAEKPAEAEANEKAPIKKPTKKPVKRLDPKRAALGPVRIDRMPVPVVPPNKRYARLPAYYSQVVNEQQRKHIYAIQRLFGPKLEEYKLKYEALKKQRDNKIEQVLTPQQQAQIEQFKLAAKAKRAAGKQ